MPGKGQKFQSTWQPGAHLGSLGKETKTSLNPQQNGDQGEEAPLSAYPRVVALKGAGLREEQRLGSVG